jgi:hypothetical protein
MKRSKQRDITTALFAALHTTWRFHMHSLKLIRLISQTRLSGDAL